MRSSYLSNVNFGDIFQTIIKMKNPKRIVEFGILDGFSLDVFAKYSSNDCVIEGYDIFEEFNGNKPCKKSLHEKFSKYDNVTIDYGNFYNCIDKFDDNSIDIIHIDIANTGDVYEFAIENYVKKIKKDGLMILEGGSKDRDNVEWMTKYNKSPIVPIIEKYKSKYNIFTIDKHPSMTMILL
jgi:predicted O-methyltransferase YrrM